VGRGGVWWVDAFGNCQTNVAPDDLRSVGLAPGDRVVVEVGGTRHEMVWQATYGEAGEAGVVHIDSYGLVAVAVPGGRADQAFGLAEGAAVSFVRGPG
jgi:S-adenosylmethionine hydrolase